MERRAVGDRPSAGDLGAAYRNPFGIIVLGGVVIGVVLAVVFGDARWLGVGVLGAVIALPVKLEGLRRSLEAANERRLDELAATMQELTDEHRRGIKGVGGRLAALGALHGEREAHLARLAANVARLSGDADADPDAATEGRGAE